MSAPPPRSDALTLRLAMSLDPDLVLAFADLKAFDQWDCGLRIALSLVNPSALGPAAAHAGARGHLGTPGLASASVQHSLVRTALSLQAAEGGLAFQPGAAGGPAAAGGSWRCALLRGARRASVDDPSGTRLRRAQEWAARSAEVVARHAGVGGGGGPSSSAGAGAPAAAVAGLGLFPLPHQLSLPSVNLPRIRPRPLLSQTGYSVGSHPAARAWRGARGVTASSDGDAGGFAAHFSGRSPPPPPPPPPLGGGSRPRSSLRRTSSDSGSSGGGGGRRQAGGAAALDIALIRAALLKPHSMQVAVPAGPVPAHARRGEEQQEEEVRRSLQRRAAGSSGGGCGGSPQSGRAPAPPPAAEFLLSVGCELMAWAAAAAGGGARPCSGRGSASGGPEAPAAEAEARAEGRAGGITALPRKRSCGALSAKALALAGDALEASPRAPAGLEGMGSADGLLSFGSGGLLKARFTRASGDTSSGGGADALPPSKPRSGRRGGAATSSPRFAGDAGLGADAAASLWAEVGAEETLATAPAPSPPPPLLPRQRSAPECLPLPEGLTAAGALALASGGCGGAKQGSGSGCGSRASSAAAGGGELTRDSVRSSATGSFVFSLAARPDAGPGAACGAPRPPLSVRVPDAAAPSPFDGFGEARQCGSAPGAGAVRAASPFAQQCSAGTGAAGAAVPAPGCALETQDSDCGSPNGLRGHGGAAASSLTLGSFSLGSFTAGSFSAATLCDGSFSREVSFVSPPAAAAALGGAFQDAASPITSPGRGAFSARASPLGISSGPYPDDGAIAATALAAAPEGSAAAAAESLTGRTLARGPSSARRATTSFRQARASAGGTIVSEAWTRASSMSWCTGGDAEELQSASGWSANVAASGAAGPGADGGAWAIAAAAAAAAESAPVARPRLSHWASQPDLGIRAEVSSTPPVEGDGQEAASNGGAAASPRQLKRCSSGSAALPPLPAMAADGRARAFALCAQGAMLPALLEADGGGEGEDGGLPSSRALEAPAPVAAAGSGELAGLDKQPPGCWAFPSKQQQHEQKQAAKIPAVAAEVAPVVFARDGGGGKPGSCGGRGPPRSSGGGGQRPLSMGGAYREALAAGAAAAARFGPIAPLGLASLALQHGDSTAQGPAGCCPGGAALGCVCSGGSLSPRHMQLRLEVPKHRRASSAHSLAWDGSGQWSAGARTIRQPSLWRNGGAGGTPHCSPLWRAGHQSQAPACQAAAE
jgi:hypothetical protein